jgi:EAL domain-containing protein (putative c-di-GMP-specific phosphodiesterase class I)
LGLGCVAEGIEHERQAKFLLDLGCENGQGYLFGAPADEAAATALLTRLTATRMVLPVEGASLTMVPA